MEGLWPQLVLRDPLPRAARPLDAAAPLPLAQLEAHKGRRVIVREGGGVARVLARCYGVVESGQWSSAQMMQRQGSSPS